MSYKRIGTFNSGGGIMITHGSVTIEGKKEALVLISEEVITAYKLEGTYLTEAEYEDLYDRMEGDLSDNEVVLWSKLDGFSNVWFSINLGDDDREIIVKEAKAL